MIYEKEWKGIYLYKLERQIYVINLHNHKIAVVIDTLYLNIRKIAFMHTVISH